MLINVSKLKKSFGNEVLFSDVSFSVDDKDKIGFIGINGAGKSTLVKILMGEIPYDEGSIFRNKLLKIGYLEQYACDNSEKSVFDEVKTVFSEVEAIDKELNMITLDLEMGSGIQEQLIERQHRLRERFSELDGYYYENKIKSCLTGLGFSEEELHKSVSCLSGGQKTRVALAKILLSDCNLLFLDEPTNHLDITSTEWLENFLREYKGAFIVISHDRYFLDRVTKKTISLESGRLYSMNGGYSDFIKQREIERLSEQRTYDNTRREIERLESVIEQQKRWNREKNIKTAENKQKVVDRLMQDMAKPDKLPDELKFKFRTLSGGGEEVVIMRGVSKTYGKTLINCADFDILKGERVFLLGENGCGKTTLLKMICGLENTDSGDIKIGANTKIGYYDQIQESLSGDKTLIDEVWDEYPELTETQIRNALATFLFRGDEVFRTVDKLSGGERARVQLAKLILNQVNFLVLDEPTNHLDIQSREALENALLEYEGTILAVSHDRYLINKLATKIAHFENKKITVYGGGYDYFLEKQSAETVVNKQSEKPKNSDYNEQKRLASEKRKRETRIKRLEEEINKLEEEIKNIEAELINTGSDYIKAAEFAKEADEKNNKLELLYAEWEELQ